MVYSFLHFIVIYQHFSLLLNPFKCKGAVYTFHTLLLLLLLSETMAALEVVWHITHNEAQNKTHDQDRVAGGI